MANDNLYNLCLMLVFFVLYSMWVSLVFGIEAKENNAFSLHESYSASQHLRQK